MLQYTTRRKETALPSRKRNSRGKCLARPAAHFRTTEKDRTEYDSLAARKCCSKMRIIAFSSSRWSVVFYRSRQIPARWYHYTLDLVSYTWKEKSRNPACFLSRSPLRLAPKFWRTPRGKSMQA